MPPFPLETTWHHLQQRLAAHDPVPPTGVDKSLYARIAEHIVRQAVVWQGSDGMVVDPYRHEPDHFATARLVGAMGNLIAAGRCDDLLDRCVAAYEAVLDRFSIPAHSPEFLTKELVWAHGALHGRVDPSLLARWEEVWAAHDPMCAYNCTTRGLAHNFVVFAATGEFLRHRAGLPMRGCVVDGLLAGQRQHFTDNGMYRDPGDPMTYDLVVRQQLDHMLTLGYDGAERIWMEEVCRRGAIASLLMQSVTGQMPFGGRSNQFHFVEAHFACLCECRARRYRESGRPELAGAFKRAGRRAVAMTVPWILSMDPLRQTKQGFLPSMEHGIDSGGYYSVYALLTAGLCAAAYHLADDTIAEAATPAEIGGYALDLWPDFHKVFATCEGYHLQIDTRADPTKDATGLGRLQYRGAWPETALSASITATPAYSFAFAAPEHNLAIGPAWLDAAGREHRLADFSPQIVDAKLRVTQHTPESLRFEVVYSGDLGGVECIVETYDLSADGLWYSAELSPRPATVWLTIPAIRTDGSAESTDASDGRTMRIAYRGWRFEATGDGVRRLPHPPSANRNALYDTFAVAADCVHLRIVEEADDVRDDHQHQPCSGVDAVGGCGGRGRGL